MLVHPCTLHKAKPCILVVSTHPFPYVLRFKAQDMRNFPDTLPWLLLIKLYPIDTIHTKPPVEIQRFIFIGKQHGIPNINLVFFRITDLSELLEGSVRTI